ncbi:alanine racemase [bacterium BMS3Bbin02]|nr:alanine racemase [bacterium BMS3Bbin02]
MRPSWIEIDVDAIEHNVAEIARIVAPAEVCAVVKADGYGHGDIPAAEAALAGGAGYLAVALVGEGIRLREAGVEVPILVLSEPGMDAAEDVVKWRLTPTAYRRSFVDTVGDAVVAAGADPVPVHVKVDTGMFRVGAAPDDAVELVQHIVRDERLVLGGVFTHLAVAEEDANFTALQLDRFAKFLDRLCDAGTQPPLVHAANTAGALGVPESRFNLVRVGLGCYGLYPHPDQKTTADLRPAMRVVSHVSMVKTVEAGERPSYGRRRPLPATSRVATVPVGYADGVPRRLSGLGASVLINGERFPLAGTVTMDQIVVDCGDADVAVGDEVVLLGSQGEERISAEEWADMLGTVNYEIVCHFGPRLPRRHLR